MQAITEAFQMSPAYFYTVVGILGLLIGSFLNVVASRVPKGMSVIHPPSHCESCGHRLSLLDLIPVFSWVASRGKCRYCGESFSIRYALWEAVTGGLFVLTAAVLGPVYELIPGLVLGFKTILEDGMDKAAAGLTTISEVYRVSNNQ